MASTYFTLVTDSGTRKMLEALNEEKKVNVTQFAVGDGGGRYYTPTTEATGLKNEVWRGPVNACYISKDSGNLLIVESVIPSDIGGFTIREMGLYDDTGVLIAICNTPDTQKVKVSDGVVHELDLSMEIALANTESVELIVDPSVVMATKKDVEKLRLNVEKDMDKMKRNMVNMAMVMATLTEADIMDSDNVVIETFSSNDDVIMVSGMFDNANKCVYA